MGYIIHQLETDFFISEKFKSEALSSIKSFAENKKKVAFVQLSEIISAIDLEQALTVLRWLPENNEAGDIIEINFTGEKLGDDYRIFDSIACFVRSESFITIVGDDGEKTKLWRWLFLDKNITEQQGTLVFE